MENEKIESQKISDNNVENVTGGFKFHIDTTDEKIPAKVDALYLTWKEYYELRKAGIVGKDKTINMNALRASNKEISAKVQKILSHPQLTAGNKKLWEVKVNMV